MSYMQLKGMQSALAIGSLFAAQMGFMLPASAQIPSGSYQESCENWAYEGTTLSADCYTIEGNLNPTQLNTARCIGEIANIDGYLSCTQGDAEPPDGSYLETCTDLNVTLLGRGNRRVPPFNQFPMLYRLEASCQDVDGNWNYSSIDFWSRECVSDISNDNGVLRKIEGGLCAQQ